MNDPIVAQVREARDDLARKFGYDLHAIFADVCERQKALGARLVPQPQKATAARQAGENPADTAHPGT